MQFRPPTTTWPYCLRWTDPHVSSPFTVRGIAGLADTFPSFSVSGPFPLMFQAFRSLLKLSVHFNFGLPLERSPSIFISTTDRMLSVSSLLLTCPNHSNLLMTITIGSTLTSSKLSRTIPTFSFSWPSLSVPPKVTSCLVCNVSEPCQPSPSHDHRYQFHPRLLHVLFVTCPNHANLLLLMTIAISSTQGYFMSCL